MTQEMNMTDHSLPLAIADELNRMEGNLQHMDSNVKGYKQLYSSVERMKRTLQAYGYEIVNLQGLPYTDGMTVIAHFVLDEEMELDEPPRITNVVKPQVNYQGHIIQVPEVTVSQAF